MITPEFDVRLSASLAEILGPDWVVFGQSFPEKTWRNPETLDLHIQSQLESNGIGVPWVLDIPNKLRIFKKNALEVKFDDKEFWKILSGMRSLAFPRRNEEGGIYDSVNFGDLVHGEPSPEGVLLAAHILNLHTDFQDGFFTPVGVELRSFPGGSPVDAVLHALKFQSEHIRSVSENLLGKFKNIRLEIKDDLIKEFMHAHLNYHEDELCKLIDICESSLTGESASGTLLGVKKLLFTRYVAGVFCGELSRKGLSRFDNNQFSLDDEINMYHQSY